MMTKTQVKKGLARGVSWFSALFLLTGGTAWSATTVSDNWTATSASDGVVVTFNVTAVTASLPAVFGSQKRVTLIPGSTDPSVTFVGNYKVAGASHIAFDLASNGPIDGGTQVQLVAGEPSRKWLRRELVTGPNSISLVRASGGWILGSLGYEGADLDQLWAQDIENVTSLGLIASRSQAAAGSQDITVSNFSISSTRAIGAALTLEDRLMDRFGVSSVADLSDEQLAADSDGDGMTDVNEILAENDPYGYFESLFKAEVVAVEKGSVTVKFACVKGLTYTIIRTTEVGGATEYQGVITAGDTGYATYTDTNPVEGANAYYYVIQN